MTGGQSTARPLSHGRQLLWFLEQLLAGSTAYQFPAALRPASHLSVGPGADDGSLA